MDSLTHSNQFQTENESYSDHQYVSDILLCSLPWSPVPGLSANHEKNINYDYFINYKQTIASNWNGKICSDICPRALSVSRSKL